MKNNVVTLLKKIKRNIFSDIIRVHSLLHKKNDSKEDVAFVIIFNVDDIFSKIVNKIFILLSCLTSYKIKNLQISEST